MTARAWLAGLLLIVIVVSLSACGHNTSTNHSTTETAAMSCARQENMMANNAQYSFENGLWVFKSENDRYVLSEEEVRNRGIFDYCGQENERHYRGFDVNQRSDGHPPRDRRHYRVRGQNEGYGRQG